MKIIFLKKKPRKNVEKIKKTCWWCFASQEWSQILSQKEFFLENALFAETPPSSKKNGFLV